jgi:SAM-dependent methyltransferase
VFEALVREGDLRGRRVLEVGGGTGRLATALTERAGCRVWLVDPSPEMLAQARRRVPATVGLKEGVAEALPFRDGWFERGVAQLSLHLWNRPRAFAELRRTIAGRVALATFDPTHFSDYWLNAFFPSIERIDRARFPDRETLERELLAAGFAHVRFAALSHRAEISREQALAKIEGRHISTFDLLDADELRAGTESARSELPGRVVYRQEWLIAVAG